ncbi:MAG TPA: IS1 family transposase [Candidatus Saccharimonadia bacterium]|nr:IS1 family transposase [Candidatus Saccharimonadia bacterium]
MEVGQHDRSDRDKRLTRKTICFSRSILMHDLVVGLFINRYAFGYAV